MSKVTGTSRAFRWLAWHPVWTDDRGWRWLRMVYRRRFYLNLDGQPAMSWFVHSVTDPESHCPVSGERVCPWHPDGGNHPGAAA